MFDHHEGCSLCLRCWIHSLAWRAFWQTNDTAHPFVAPVVELKGVLGEKQHGNSRAKFAEVINKSDDMREMFQHFLRDCEAKSESCRF